jgi:hypothetical protein
VKRRQLSAGRWTAGGEIPGKAGDRRSANHEIELNMFKVFGRMIDQ